MTLFEKLLGGLNRQDVIGSVRCDECKKECPSLSTMVLIEVRGQHYRLCSQTCKAIVEFERGDK